MILSVYQSLREEMNFALNVSMLVADNTRPELLRFASMNLRSNSIILQFTEAINVDSIDLEAITLQTLFVDPLQSYNLTGGRVGFNDPGATELVIYLNSRDVVAIKQDQRLCSNRATCYVRLYGSFVIDTSGNSLIPTRDEFPGHLVFDFVADDLPPALNSFDLNLNTSELILYFNEPVNAATLQVSLISLQGSSNVTLSDGQFYFTGGEVSQGEDYAEVIVSFTYDDLNNLKLQSFAKNNETTFLAATDDFIFDTAYAPNGAEGIF